MIRCSAGLITISRHVAGNPAQARPGAKIDVVGLRLRSNGVIGDYSWSGLGKLILAFPQLWQQGDGPERRRRRVSTDWWTPCRFCQNGVSSSLDDSPVTISSVSDFSAWSSVRMEV